MSGEKRISQATFDEAVEENVREFSMSREEAVADAVQQFEAAGVTLSGIVTDGSDPGVHPVVGPIRVLKAWAVDGVETSPEAVRGACAGLVEQCGRNMASKGVARSNGGVTFVTAAVVAAAKGGDVGLRKCTLDALRALCSNHDDNRGEVDATVVVPLILAACGAEAPIEVRRAGLLTAAVLCVRREGFKTSLFDGGLPDILVAALRAEAAAGAGARTGGLLRETCVAMSRLLTDDDMSVLASNAYAYARVVASSGVAEVLLRALRARIGDADE